MEKTDIEFLQKVMEQISQSAFEFSKAILPVLQKFRDEMTGYYKTIYPILRREYETAGCPYGLEDEGMWNWLKGKAHTAAQDDFLETEELWVNDVLKLQDYMKSRVN